MTFRRRWAGAYLAALSITGHYRKSCLAAGDISFQTVWEERNRNSAFAKAEKDARAAATMALEDEARRRAVDGTFVYKFLSDGTCVIDPDTGEPYREYSYSDTLLKLLLAAQRPDIYVERVRTENETHTTNLNVNGVVSEERLAELQKLREEALKSL